MSKDRSLEKDTSKSRALQSTRKSSPLEAQAQNDHPLAQAINRMVNTGSVSTDAAVLQRTPSLAQHSLLQLQLQYGNQYVQRVVQLAKQGNGQTGVNPEVEAAIQRQPQPTILQPEEPLEKETDQMPQTVMRIPDPLKTNLEQLSGMDLSGVRVHYNSSKPAKIDALAYTQGQEVHIGPGQEKHLPHEGWHVVQQMQGRVNPTMQAKGVSINDDVGLEREADEIGTKALQMKRSGQAITNSAPQGSNAHIIIQRKLDRPMQPGEWVPLMIKGLQDGRDRADNAAQNLIQATLLATQEFRLFTSNLISDLKGQINGTDLVESLVTVFPMTFIAVLADKTASQFAKVIISEFGNKMNETIVNGATKQSKNLSNSVDDLKKAVEIIISETLYLKSNLPQFVAENYGKPSEQIIEKLKNKNYSLSREEFHFAEPFLLAVDLKSKIDKAVQNTIGLPIPELLTDYQVAIYRNWVSKFTEKWFPINIKLHSPGTQLLELTSSFHQSGRFRKEELISHMVDYETKKYAKKLKAHKPPGNIYRFRP